MSVGSIFPNSSHHTKSQKFFPTPEKHSGSVLYLIFPLPAHFHVKNNRKTIIHKSFSTLGQSISALGQQIPVKLSASVLLLPPFAHLPRSKSSSDPVASPSNSKKKVFLSGDKQKSSKHTLPRKRSKQAQSGRKISFFFLLMLGFLRRAFCYKSRPVRPCLFFTPSFSGSFGWGARKVGKLIF